MKPRFLRLRTAVALFALILLTSVMTPLSEAVEPKAVEPSRSRADLATGTVTVLGPASCPAGAAKGATCVSVRVSCTGLPDLDATLGVTSPSGAASGTIILANGGAGTAFLNDAFPDTYVGDGFNVVQFAWASDWASANGAGVKSAACRPASLFQYAFNVVQQQSRKTGFCGQGFSGGGAAFAYALSEYGMSNYFDYVVIAAGPGVARMDYGCDPSLYKGAARDLCPLLTNAPFAYPLGTAAKVNGWEDTTTCAQPNPLPSDIDRWTDDSIVTNGATYNYPQTAMSWFFCVTPGTLNESTGQGSFLIDRVVPQNAPPDVNCYSGICQGEDVWTDPTAFSTTASEMLGLCVPNH
jgi:hypothetical protein